MLVRRRAGVIGALRDADGKELRSTAPSAIPVRVGCWGKAQAKAIGHSGVGTATSLTVNAKVGTMVLTLTEEGPLFLKKPVSLPDQ
jgi:hypothetical protein